MEFLPATEAVVSFAITSMVIELTPGPNMTYLAIVAAGEGRNRGYVTVAGVALGLALIGLAGALGVAALIERSPTFYEVLRWAGVAFLLFLAWEGWTKPASGVVNTVTDGPMRYFMRGFVTNVLNPKAAVFYIAVLPAFVDPAKPVLGQTLTLTAIYVIVATAIHAAIVALAGALAPMLNNPRREQVARRFLSTALAGVALWFAWSTAR